MSMLPQSLAHHRGVVGFASGVIVAGLLVGGGAAIAAIPSTATSTYTACANKSTGALRVIDYQAGKRCTSRENAVSWAKGYRYRGTWRAATVYAPLDVVVYNGSSYLAKLASKGKSPATMTSYWALLAAKGATGPAGPTGPTGPRGDVGAPGPKGEPGTPGTARGFAVVGRDGSLGTNSGNVTVLHGNTGLYCVTVTGADPTRNVATVSPDYATDTTADKGVVDPGNVAHVEVLSTGNCTPGFTVVTFQVQLGAPGVDASVTRADEGFTILVG